MNREIKFRAYDVYTKKMIFTGFHLFGEVLSFNCLDQWCYENPNPKLKSQILRCNDIKITQFTGRKDKNGKEIYEGDIVKREITDYDKINSEDILEDTIDWENLPKKIEISFIEYMGHGFWVKDEDFGWEGENLWDWKDIEIIGNVFENPKLLEPKIGEKPKDEE